MNQVRTSKKEYDIVDALDEICDLKTIIDKLKSLPKDEIYSRLDNMFSEYRPL